MGKKKETDAGLWVVAIILAVLAVMIATTMIKLYEVDIKALPSNGADVP